MKKKVDLNLTIIKKPIVGSKTAKLAKKKNIIISSAMHYDDNGVSWYGESGCRNERKIEGKEIPAPLQVDLQKCLREEYNIDVYIIPNGRAKKEGRNLYHPIIWFKHEYQSELKSYNSYEKAMEEGLYNALKLIKQK